MSAHIGGQRLVDLGLRCLRLILFRNSTYDGIAHDIAAAVNHIGGGVCKNAGGEPACLSIGSKIHHQEFAFHQEMIESFANAVDSATLEEKRRLLRTIVKKVVWDGKNAYVYLFAEDGEADLPPVEQPMYPLGEDSE